MTCSTVTGVNAEICPFENDATAKVKQSSTTCYKYIINIIIRVHVEYKYYSNDRENYFVFL